jgi:hypothetical protein
MIGDVAIGLAVFSARVMARPVRLVGRTPVVGSVVRQIGAGLAADGRAARTLVIAPELQHMLDNVLAGPVTDAIARSLGQNRVAERVASQVLADLDVDSIVAAVLADERTERTVARMLDSREMRLIIGHIASSPELLEAVTYHTETLAEEMVTGVRTRAQRVDDVAERTVRGWLRHPRPRPA